MKNLRNWLARILQECGCLTVVLCSRTLAFSHFSLTKKPNPIPKNLFLVWTAAASVGPLMVPATWCLIWRQRQGRRRSNDWWQGQRRSNAPTGIRTATTAPMTMTAVGTALTDTVLTNTAPTDPVPTNTALTDTVLTSMDLLALAVEKISWLVSRQYLGRDDDWFAVVVVVSTTSTNGRKTFVWRGSFMAEARKEVERGEQGR